MSSKINYSLIIILSIAVIVLGVLVGFFYGQTLNFKEKTITNTQTITNIQYPSQTVTNTITVTQTWTSPTTVTKTITVTTTIPITTTISNFTRFEKLEISSAYAYSAILIVINVSNTGSSDATITDVFVNGKPAASFTPAGTLAPALPLPLASGASTTITLTFAAPGLVSGVTYDIKIHTASGTDYPKAVVIP
jgi:hypothetical protein